MKIKTKKICILGSTGSIGLSAAAVASHLKGAVEITGLAAGSNAKLLFEQVKAFRPKVAAISDPAAGEWLKKKLKGLKMAPKLYVGEDALVAAAVHPSSQMVLTSVVGARGLVPTMQAIQAGKDIALANKETMVAAGELVSRAAAKKGVRILPVDSEHNAIFQCLEALPRASEIKRLILTASGGPFRTWSAARIKKVTPAQALKHPTWKMGAKITVDSATMMNKGLEVIEARWLFDVPFEKIDVMVHPQSVVHSMVETVDQSILAQLGPTDMRLPIQFAFTWPLRRDAGLKSLDFAKLQDLTFEKPDGKRFPCLALAYKAGAMGGAAPAVLNAANEIAVDAFLNRKLSFMGIPALLAKVLQRFAKQAPLSNTLNSMISADLWARREAGHLLLKGSSNA